MRTTVCLAALAALTGAMNLWAADNALTAAEAEQGWILLFNGKDLSGWETKANQPLPDTAIQDGSINPHFRGSGGLVVTKRWYSDFVLACDFKVSPKCNSGIFLRVGNPKDEVQTGLEIQVFDSAGKKALGKHDCGALYDAQAPTKNTMKPAGEWNHLEITAAKNIIQVVLNGEEIVKADLDTYTEPHKNADGSKNKYAKPLKDFPRSGHIGFQDHGHDVWYKNIKLKPLTLK